MSHHVDKSLKYADTHEWVRVEGNIAVIGISDHAQGLLGDLVYVELPKIGKKVQKGGEVGVVESVKAASDVYAPVSGEVVAVNQTLEGAPETVNSAPYGDGWICKIAMSDSKELDSLFTAAQYQQQIDA